jgi:phenylalanyl-tRNA synthetase beta chain
MKFAVSWLEEWVDPRMSAGDLAHRITMAGLEVDSIEADGQGLEGIVIGEVLEAAQHPDADRLSVCKVSTGDGVAVDVVCGAPNVRAGLRSPLAVPGSTLPDGTRLRRSKIRGVVSNGMLCSAIELGLGSESDGILELPDDAPVGAALIEYLGLPDTVVDVDITPNRGDCFSVLGIARDVAALTRRPLEGPAMHVLDAATDTVYPVERPVPEACPRFAHRVVEGIDPQARSPLWMTERLRKSGLRAIHPVVDVTNYVMLELGQPLHAYDMDKLRGPIRPRFARPGETVTLLDERQVELREDTVVISDDSGVIGMAGIMGGLSTMVTAQTTNVFFEAAFWPQDVMAGRARSYAMHTDASMRFERGVDPAGQARAVERAVELLVMIAGGKPGRLVDDYDDQHLPTRDALMLTRRRLDQVLGAEIPDARVTEILASLGLETEVLDGAWNVIPPSYRFDIAIEDDLVEEVARIYGYDRIPEATATANMPLGPVSEASVDLDLVANALVARDYFEVITYSFVDAEADNAVSGESNELVLSNPISSEMSVMRSSLWTGMLEVAAKNAARQQDRVRIFEVGKTYHGSLQKPVEVVRVGALAQGGVVSQQWGATARTLDFFDLKADVEALLSMTGEADVFSFHAADHPALQPGQSACVHRGEQVVGVLGKIHPSLAKRFDLRQDVFVFELDAARAFAAGIPVAQPISRYPSVRRDIAILVREEVRSAELVEAVYAASPELVRDVTVFDVYHGSAIEAGLKSVALGLILQETSRTLTDEDADSVVSAAVRKLKQDFNADLRD